MKGADIIKAVMVERGIGEADFFTSRFPEHVDARRVAILRMVELGFNTSKISRLMHRSRTVVRYWSSPQERERMNAKRTELYRKQQAVAP